MRSMGLAHRDDTLVLLLGKQSRVIFVEREASAMTRERWRHDHRSASRRAESRANEAAPASRVPCTYRIGNRNRAEQHAIDRNEHERVAVATE
jgi:hypothetical protein